MKKMCTCCLLVLSALLWGCAGNAPKVSNAFDDLVNETSQTETFMLDYRSFLSISGLAPVRFAGAYLLHPPKVSPTHAIGVSPKWSFFLVSEYPVPPAELGTLRGISTKYQDLLIAARQLAAQQLLAAAAEKAGGEGKDHDTTMCTILSIGKDACNPDAIKKAVEKVKGDLKKQSDRFETLKLEFNRDSNVTNSILMRWEKMSDDGLMANYGAILTGGYKQRLGRSGLAIYGDMRVESLYVGEDFLDMVADFNTFSRKFLFTRSSIPTYTVQAKYIEYVSDGDESTDASLNAAFSVSQLVEIKKALANLSDTTKIGMKLVHQLVASVGNKGRLQDPKTSFRPHCFFPARLHQDFIQAAAKRQEGYSTIYGVESQLQFVATLFMSLPETDLSKILRLPEKQRNEMLGQYGGQCDGTAKAWDAFAAPFVNEIARNR